MSLQIYMRIVPLKIFYFNFHFSSFIGQAHSPKKSRVMMMLMTVHLLKGNYNSSRVILQASKYNIFVQEAVHHPFPKQFTSFSFSLSWSNNWWNLPISMQLLTLLIDQHIQELMEAGNV